MFWGLDETDYSGVAVVGLGKQNLGVNKLEEIHEGKENVRAAAAGKILDDKKIYFYLLYKTGLCVIVKLLLLLFQRAVAL